MRTHLKPFYEKVKQQPHKLPPVCGKQNKHLRKILEARELEMTMWDLPQII